MCHLGETPKLECTAVPEAVRVGPKFLWLSLRVSKTTVPLTSGHAPLPSFQIAPAASPPQPCLPCPMLTHEINTEALHHSGRGGEDRRQEKTKEGYREFWKKFSEQ